ARQLVTLLDTRDRINETIGDRTFKTTSAADLPELAFTVRWALKAGALRKEHGKLRATVAWDKLGGKPLERWIKVADALPPLGPIAAFHANSRYRSGEEVLDELAPEVLQLLVRQSMAFDEVLDWVCDQADLTYEWIAPYMQDPDHRRTGFGWDLDLLALILGWAGIAERNETHLEPARYGDDRLVGGTLALTRVGRWWLSER
ncbi:MAG: hypothetical protein ACRDZY_22765, partial [Acidimicrobiales bacterium]